MVFERSAPRAALVVTLLTFARDDKSFGVSRVEKLRVTDVVRQRGVG